MNDQLCAYCGLHGDLTDFHFGVTVCRQCLEVIKAGAPRHEFVAERRGWVRAKRGIPENNVTVISQPWEPTPFRRKRVKKWTRADRERLKR